MLPAQGALCRRPDMRSPCTSPVKQDGSNAAFLSCQLIQRRLQPSSTQGGRRGRERLRGWLRLPAWG